MSIKQEGLSFYVLEISAVRRFVTVHTCDGRTNRSPIDRACMHRAVIMQTHEMIKQQLFQDAAYMAAGWIRKRLASICTFTADLTMFHHFDMSPRTL